MQEKMAREMKETTVDAAAGGGAVTVKMRGDFEGALGSYRRAVLQLGRAGQNEVAATFLQEFASLSVMVGQSSASLLTVALDVVAR